MNTSQRAGSWKLLTAPSSLRTLALALAFWPAFATADTTIPKAQTVIFACKYGTIKSQMAASYFNRVAAERGLPVIAVSRAFNPGTEVPPELRASMAGDGLAPVDEIFPELTPHEAAAAAKLISFDEVPVEKGGATPAVVWADVPKVRPNYRFAMDMIMRRVDGVIATIETEMRDAELARTEGSARAAAQK